MGQLFNIYCDESCHLENDQQTAMVLGALWCLDDEKQRFFTRIREIKVKHAIPIDFEVKWTKVSPGKVNFYMDLIDFFFDSNGLYFRGLLIPDKTKLNHTEFSQTHDEWYYKMYFNMLKVIFEPKTHYHIYLDIKDSRGGTKIQKLHDVISNNMYDFNKEIVRRIQLVHSHEVEILQLADILIGAVSYINRRLDTSHAKKDLVERIMQRSGYELTKSTLVRENKFNLFRWVPSGE